MRVPFIDLSAQYAPIRAEIDEAISRVIDNTAFILGDAVQEFENDFARYTGRSHCIGVNSGTSALHLALLVAGVRPGDEVVTTPFSWISTSWAISYCGARPVFAEVDPATGNLDPAAAEAVISPSTKAILPVDLFGNPAALDGFEEIAHDRGLRMIDDAAQAHGAQLNGQIVGSFGDLACFSFYPGKNLGAVGEAGALVTNDADMADRIRALRDHAQTSRHHHAEIGFNYRMEGLQGAILSIKLGYLNGWNEARRLAAARYDALLSQIPGVQLPVATPGATPSVHLYPIRVDNRKALAESLRSAGVAFGIHYPTPIHLQPAYASLGYRPGSFPHAERYASRCLSLPMYPEITPEQQEHVASVIATAVGES